MKISKALALMVVLAAPASALAGTTITPTTTISVGSQTIRPSNNVFLYVTSNSAAYGSGAAHSKGDRLFGTSSADNKIYWQDKTGVTSILGADVAAAIASSSPVFGAGWSAL